MDYDSSYEDPVAETTALQVKSAAKSFPIAKTSRPIGSRVILKHFAEEAIMKEPFGFNSEYVSVFPGRLVFGKLHYVDGRFGYSEEAAYVVPVISLAIFVECLKDMVSNLSLLDYLKKNDKSSKKGKSKQSVTSADLTADFKEVQITLPEKNVHIVGIISKNFVGFKKIELIEENKPNYLNNSKIQFETMDSIVEFIEKIGKLCIWLTIPDKLEERCLRKLMEEFHSWSKNDVEVQFKNMEEDEQITWDAAEYILAKLNENVSFFAIKKIDLYFRNNLEIFNLCYTLNAMLK